MEVSQSNTVEIHRADISDAPFIAENTVEIRRADISDAPFIAENTVLIEKETNFLDVDYDITLKLVQKRLSLPDCISYWIASVDGTDAGSMSLQFEPKFARNNYYTQLQLVFIREGFRNKKIFKRFNELMNEQGKLTNCFGFKLSVNRFNDGPRDIYKHYGYIFPRTETWKFSTLY